MDAHIDSVARIATAIRRFDEAKTPWRVYHGGSNSTRAPQYSRNAVVDTSGLTNVLRIDHERKTALVEPNVSMRKLAEATLTEGLIPAVVMEFPAITVGGGFSGNSGESSSWKYGLFDETVRSIEIVLANGEVKNASESENRDLFRGAAGGHGTLGVVTALEVQLLRSKPYVELVCHPVANVAEASKFMQRAFSADHSPEFIDGILFQDGSGTIMLGNPVSSPSPSSPLIRFDRARDQWFYRAIEKRLAAHKSSSSSASFSLTTPLLSYLFRYDRGAFWGGKYAFRYLFTPYNRITRFVLDPLLHASTMFKALHGSGLAAMTTVQDIGVPLRNLPAFVDYLRTTFGFEYWWLCPIRHAPGRRISFARDAFSSSSGNSQPADKDSVPAARGLDSDEIWVNVGIWGVSATDAASFAAQNRELEATTHRLGGLKALYARTYYTEDEFWQIYDQQAYDEVRERYHASGLPSLYDKVKAVAPFQLEGWAAWWNWVAYMRPLPGLWGMLSLLKRDYLFAS